MCQEKTGERSSLYLAVDAKPVAAVAVADTPASRRQGLLGTESLSGALWITRCPSVHTFRMRYAIDVAFVDRAGVVLEVITMVPNRSGRPRLRARDVIEAEAGQMARWGIRRACVLSVVEAGPIS